MEQNRIEGTSDTDIDKLTDPSYLRYIELIKNFTKEQSSKNLIISFFILLIMMEILKKAFKR